MISMTKKAGEFLTEAMRQVPLNEQAGECFRLTRDGDGTFALKTGIKTQGDRAIVHDEKVLLVVAEGLAEGLDGKKLDLKETGVDEPVLVWT